MTRILVVSDSHGVIDNMVKAVDNTMPDIIIHLGDCWQDGIKLRLLFPDILIEQVDGNCGSRGEVRERILLIEDKRIFICHGHDYSVKMGYSRLLQAAKQRNADVVLCGHTHRICQDYYDNMAVLNPGSIGEHKMPGRPSYGIVNINKGKIDTELWYL